MIQRIRSTKEKTSFFIQIQKISIQKIAISKSLKSMKLSTLSLNKSLSMGLPSILYPLFLKVLKVIKISRKLRARRIKKSNKIYMIRIFSGEF